ncbi:MAG TPA: hypothetical protein VGF59_27215 [Bryobacteraceae bacterium]|jgi:hypothetical protein
MLTDLRDKIDRWRAAGPPEAIGAAAKRHAAAVAGPYLGFKAAERLLDPAPNTGETLLSTLEPVLRLFLGRRAASRLVTRIAAESIVRI